MIDTVTTLPISPMPESHVGLALLPLLMEMVGTGFSLHKVLALNIHGLKHNHQNAQSEKIAVARKYVESMAGLGIFPDTIWRDDLNEFKWFAQTALIRMIDDRKLIIDTRPVVKCPCGKVEFLEGSPNISLRRRLFRNLNRSQICVLCEGELRTEKHEVCLFKCEVSAAKFYAIPRFSQEELRNLVSSFNGVEYLASRMRVTHFSLNLPGLRDFDIDPDFLWSLMLPYLSSQGYSARYVVGSQRNLLACFFIGTMASTSTTFVIPPFLVGPKQISVKTFGSLDKLVAQFGPEALKFFLLTGLNWMKKESVVDLGYLDHLAAIEPALLHEATNSVLSSDPKTVTTLNGINLRNAMAKLLKGGGLK